MFTRVDSCSRMSRKASKSEYRRRTTEWRSLKAGMFVYHGPGSVGGTQQERISISGFPLGKKVRCDESIRERGRGEDER